MASNESNQEVRETLARYGSEGLTNAQLLSLLLSCKTETAEKILASFGCLAKFQNLDTYMPVEGVGKVLEGKLKALGTLMHRENAEKAFYGMDALNTASTIAATVGAEIQYNDEEHILLLSLDSKYRLINRMEISRGSVNRTILSPRECLISAVSHRAANVVIIHNHPSGDPNPSEDDIAITVRLRKVFDLANIPLVDHIIMGDRSYYSFADAGLLSD